MCQEPKPHRPDCDCSMCQLMRCTGQQQAFEAACRANVEAYRQQLPDPVKAVLDRYPALKPLLLPLEPGQVLPADCVLPRPPSIVCPQCGLVSHNASDVEQRYCGKCHEFHDDMAMKVRDMAGEYHHPRSVHRQRDRLLEEMVTQGRKAVRDSALARAVRKLW